MNVRQIAAGPMDNFCYLAWEGAGPECAVIDPCWEGAKIEKELLALGLRPALLALTHGHPDHLNAAAWFLERYEGLRAALHPADGNMAEGLDRSRLLPVADGEDLAAGALRLKVLHTPGHTPGSCSFLGPGAVFTGDTLFVGAIGRVDLPGADPEQMRRSLLKLAALPGDTAVWPGHAYNGSSTTIEAQKLHNIYVKLAAKGGDEFISAAL
ncbi:MAG TPA: MBL fold metallo-hydrolase [Elusimicrobiales bacterium]|nr:MBL fold metallo-hydrolase [Elusimicrobiales bacterium]